MLSQKNLIAACCVLALLLAMAAFTAPRLALGQMTIPTRTPVPDGGSPDPEPEPTDDNGGGGNQPQPTEEPDPGPGPQPTNEPQPTDGAQPLPPSPVPSLAPATAVPTLVVPTTTPIASAAATVAGSTATPTATAATTSTGTPAATVTAEILVPGGEVVAFPENNRPFPQAIPCGMPPTFTVLDAISVYAGPGEDYQLVGLIGATEVRPIVGRAAFSKWWVVQLDNSGRVGWVNDGTGTVHGYIGRVPIVSAPELHGIVPTPGGNSWIPTPDANCNAPHLLAAAAVNQAGSSEDEVPPSGEPDSVAGLPEYNRSGLPDYSENEQASSSEGVEAPYVQPVGESDESGVKSTLSEREAAAEPLLTELADSAAPLELPAPSTPQLPNLMPVVGLVLIIAAIFIGLYAKRNRSRADE